MKNAFALLVFIIFQTLLGCSGCKNSPSPTADNPFGLPNATQTGANIFACRINGHNWISSSSILAMGAGIFNDSLRITGEDGKQFFQRLTINLCQQQQGSVSNLVDTTKGFIDYLSDSSCLGSGSRSAIIEMKSISGTVNLIKLDRNKKIVSGTFDCIISIPHCDTLKITNGRFDIQYPY